VADNKKGGVCVKSKFAWKPGRVTISRNAFPHNYFFQFCLTPPPFPAKDRGSLFFGANRKDSQAAKKLKLRDLRAYQIGRVVPRQCVGGNCSADEIGIRQEGDQ
jgi:hypothetical protein